MQPADVEVARAPPAVPHVLRRRPVLQLQLVGQGFDLEDQVPGLEEGVLRLVLKGQQLLSGLLGIGRVVACGNRLRGNEGLDNNETPVAGRPFYCAIRQLSPHDIL